MGVCQSLCVGGTQSRKSHVYHEESDDEMDDFSDAGSDGEVSDAGDGRSQRTRSISSEASANGSAHGDCNDGMSRASSGVVEDGLGRDSWNGTRRGAHRGPKPGKESGGVSPERRGSGSFDDGVSEDGVDQTVDYLMEYLAHKDVNADYICKGPDDKSTRTKIAKSLKSLVTISQMPMDELTRLADKMIKIRVPAGTTVVKEGEFMSFVYIVNTGALEKGSNEKLSKTRRISNVGRFSTVKDLSGPWELIGQVGHLGSSGRSDCNVFTRADSTLWVIHRDDILDHVERYNRRRNHKITSFLATVKLLDVLTEGERQRLASAMQVVKVWDGKYLFRHGDVGDALYIVQSGNVECLIPNPMNPAAPQKVIRLHEGEVVGERALLNDRPRSGDVVARGHTKGAPVFFLKLLRSDFNMLLGPLAEFMGKTDNMYELRVLRETPGLQALPATVSNELAAAMQRFKVEKDVIIGNIDPLTEQHYDFTRDLDAQLVGSMDDYLPMSRHVGDLDTMPGIVIIAQGEAEVLMGASADVLLGCVSSERQDGLSNQIADDLSNNSSVASNSGRNWDTGAGETGGETPRRRNRMASSTSADAAALSMAERGHVIGLQHILFHQRSTIIRSRTRLEYLLLPRAVVERNATALAAVFGFGTPSPSASNTFLNKCFILDKLINSEVDTIVPYVRRSFLREGETMVEAGEEVSACYYVSHGSLAKISEDGFDAKRLAKANGANFKQELTENERSRRSSAGMHNLDQRNSGLPSSTVHEDSLMHPSYVSEHRYVARCFTVLLRLDRNDLEHALGNTLSSITDCDEGEYRLRLLQSVPTLSALPFSEQCKLAAAMKVRTYMAGEYIIIQGEEGDSAYIVKAGEANITITTPSRKRRSTTRTSSSTHAAAASAGGAGTDGDGDGAVGGEAGEGRRMSEVKIAEIGRGSFVGESALLENKPRNANVVAKTVVECYVVTSRLFHRHLESVKSEMKSQTSEQLVSREKKLQKYYHGSTYEHSMSMKSVNVLGYLGEGIVGKVLLVNSKTVGDQYYAVKCVRQDAVIERKLTKDIVKEVKLLRQLQCSFINGLLFTDKDDEYVFMGFHALPGCDLFARLQDCGAFSEDVARFYAVGVVSALEHLHQRNIAHRDLKPENVAINELGYPVLIDFGCASMIQGQAMTICGTPLYCAPEILTCSGHTPAVDCWSFGVMLYEFLSMQTPFQTDADETVDDVYENIIDGVYALPEGLSPSACSIITELLQVRECKRLGARRGHWLDVRAHEFFAGKIDMKRAAQQTLPAPWVPNFREFVDTAASKMDDAELVYSKRTSRKEGGRKSLTGSLVSGQSRQLSPGRWLATF